MGKRRTRIAEDYRQFNFTQHQPAREDLTPDDLQQAGWYIIPYFETGKWRARQLTGIGGAVYSAPDTLEEVIRYVRTVYIAKEPWQG